MFYIYGDYVGSYFMQIVYFDLVVLFGLNFLEMWMFGGGQVEELCWVLEILKVWVIIIDLCYIDLVIIEYVEWLLICLIMDVVLVVGIVYMLIIEQFFDEVLVNCYCVGYDCSILLDMVVFNDSYKDYVFGMGDDGIVKILEWVVDIIGIFVMCIC